MVWEQRNRADPECRALADRHYNRQTIGSMQFVPPGRCLVLYTQSATGRALWVTSYQYPEYVKHQWPSAWVCTLFRNENAGLASSLIQQAVAATVAQFGPPPINGMVTFIDRSKVKPIVVHGEQTWGFTYKKAGFTYVGETGGGLMVLQLAPQAMPKPDPALNYQYTLFGT